MKMKKKMKIKHNILKNKITHKKAKTGIRE